MLTATDHVISQPFSWILKCDSMWRTNSPLLLYSQDNKPLALAVLSLHVNKSHYHRTLVNIFSLKLKLLFNWNFTLARKIFSPYLIWRADLFLMACKNEIINYIFKDLFSTPFQKEIRSYFGFLSLNLLLVLWFEKCTILNANLTNTWLSILIDI